MTAHDLGFGLETLRIFNARKKLRGAIQSVRSAVLGIGEEDGEGVCVIIHGCPKEIALYPDNAGAEHVRF